MFTALLASVGLFAQTFSGSWMCAASTPAQPGHKAVVTETRWDITSAPGGNWTIVRWGAQSNDTGGIAYVGYVPSEGDWIYEDFHYDGTYGLSTSKGAQAGIWSWAGGGYYTKDAVLHGGVTWRLTKAGQIEHTFVQFVDGSPVPRGHDLCTKQAEASP
jgi:hypothetical protein